MNLLLSYYGDDFTGSTDVMEAVSRAGLRTVLFLKPPTPEQLAKFPGLRAFGVAGGSRMMSPDEMEAELPPVFEALKAGGAPIVHYKTCSTFDSSPTTGSIGRAIEIGRRIFGDRPTPLVVGAPVLGRYVVFGNLFARSGLDTEPFRLDRHPTMSRHPVTPMKEADIRLILGEQTKLPVELVDVLGLDGLSVVSDQWSVVSGQCPAPIVLFDTLREEHLPVIGRAMDGLAREGQLFVVGSSGVEYALVEHWSARGLRHTAEEGGRGGCVSEASPRPFSSAVKQIVGVSGTCSPVTYRQLQLHKHGILRLPLNSKFLLEAKNVEAYVDSTFKTVTEGARDKLKNPASFVYTVGVPPDHDSFIQGLSNEQGARLSGVLARFLEKHLEDSNIRRAVVCGGDTSMHVARALGIEALEYLGPMAPGSPLCKVHAPGRIADGCEIVFKGGQVGRDRFFLDVLNGGPLDT